MRQVLVTAPEDVRVEEVADPDPLPGQAVVDVSAVGVCGGDVGLVTGANAIAQYPVVPGHECLGRVATAPEASGLESGQPVMVFPTLSCGDCSACQNGRENQCPQMRVLGLSDPGGCCADRIAIEPGQLLPVSETVAQSFGALVEPVAVSAHVNGRGGTQPGDRVLVIGAGVVGILTALTARAYGAATVLLADRLPARADVLTPLGFPQFTTTSGAELVAWTRTHVEAVDVVYDVVVNAETMAVSVEVLRPGGTYVAVASPKPAARVPVPYDLVYGKELTILGCRNYTRADFAEALRLLEKPAYDPSEIVTDRLPFTDFGPAVDALRRAPDQHLKVLLYT